MSNPVGRPKADIDLVELKKLCTLCCTMPEIAAFFNIPLRTLEDRYTHDKEVREAIQQGRELGKLSIRRKQIQLLDNGNATMGVWLGKNILGQRDALDLTTEDKGDYKVKQAFEMINELVADKIKDPDQ